MEVEPFHDDKWFGSEMLAKGICQLLECLVMWLRARGCQKIAQKSVSVTTDLSRTVTSLSSLIEVEFDTLKVLFNLFHSPVEKDSKNQ